MIVHIDFSLFSSPTDAYGNVTGDLDIDEPVLGAEVRIFRSDDGDWFSGILKIVSITQMLNNPKLLIGLQDVVAHTREDAARIGARLEHEAGLFCDVYEKRGY
jgi:hypothetical protein